MNALRGDDVSPWSNFVRVERPAATPTPTATATPPSTPEPTNSVATGTPTISGTAQVEETLRASTTDLSDSDGMDSATFSYRWIAAGSDIDGATGSSHTLTSSQKGHVIQVRVSFTDDAGNPESRTRAATGGVAAAPPPLTGSLNNQPTSHDGTNAFTFEIEFSVEPALSCRTLRDHAFTVRGGAVKKARRRDQPSNIRWQITVEPDSNADVTIALPVTTDCAAQGAICTQDGRKLSKPLEFTVSGAGE